MLKNYNNKQWQIQFNYFYKRFINFSLYIWTIMDTYKLKFTQLEQEIFSFLCLRAGEKLSQREIAQSLKVSPTAIAKSLKKLLDINFARIEKTKTINFISLNRDKPLVIELKRAENLKNIYLSGLSDYLGRILQEVQ